MRLSESRIGRQGPVEVFQGIAEPTLIGVDHPNALERQFVIGIRLERGMEVAERCLRTAFLQVAQGALSILGGLGKVLRRVCRFGRYTAKRDGEHHSRTLPPSSRWPHGGAHGAIRKRCAGPWRSRTRRALSGRTTRFAQASHRDCCESARTMRNNPPLVNFSRSSAFCSPTVANRAAAFSASPCLRYTKPSW